MLGSALALVYCGGGGDTGATPGADSGSPLADSGPGGPPADGGKLPDGAPIPVHDSGASHPGVCGTSEWPTYGHDSQRTSASDACIKGPLTFAWGYVPQHAMFNGLAMVEHAVTAAGQIFVRYAAGYGPQLDGITTAGQYKWAWAAPGGRDRLTHTWATAALGAVLVEDDALCFVDANSGANKICTNTQYDDWGQNTADESRFYVNSDVNSPDGPGVYVGAYSADGKTAWSKDVYHKCDGVSETHGSLAVDGGKVFRSGVYTSSATGPATGYASYDATSGAPGWKQAATPASAISAGGGRLYAIENTGSTALVARNQSDGAVAWTQPIASASVSVQAPVLANGLVIVATANDVRAFHDDTGDPAWTAQNIAAATGEFTGNGNFARCAAQISWSTFAFTSLAAAVGSNTLLVTAKDAVHVLSLDDGSDQWHGTPGSVTGPLRNPILVDHTVYAVDTGVAKGKLVAMTAP